MFLTNFKSVEDIANTYGGTRWANDYEKGDSSAEKILANLHGATIHLAWYGYGFYSGSSFVIFEKDGKLYEWSPEETSWEALALRKFDSVYDEDEGEKEAYNILTNLVKEHLPPTSTIN